MRTLAVLLAALLIAGCSTAPATRDRSRPAQDNDPGAPVEFLLTSAATDFHTHRPPDPVRFRDVRIGYTLRADGTRQYLLCGEFLPAQPARETGTPEWTPFVTIKTSGYEQYLGAGATGFCQRSSITWEKGDWSSALQSRLDSLR